MFTKPTFSGVFTSFDSFIPISYKHGLVNILIFQCFKIWSSYEKLHNEIFSVTDILIILLIFVLKSFLINSILPQKTLSNG